MKLRRKSNLTRGTFKIWEPAPQEGLKKWIWNRLGKIRPSEARNKVFHWTSGERLL